MQVSLAALDERLDAAAADLPPDRYIELRRYLNQLKEAVKSLGNTRQGVAYNNKIPSDIHTVAELVDYMSRKGLAFAPAVAPGDQNAYSAFYLAFRNFETSAVLAAR